MLTQSSPCLTLLKLLLLNHARNVGYIWLIIF